MSKFIMSLGVRDVPLIGEALADIVNNIMSLFYGLYFALVKAIAWVLDMLTQLFFIFSGMTPVSATAAGMSNGEYQEVDIVNFFLTQPSFQKAYLYLCLIALGLIIVFAIGKIIKQDYFDRHGPRSKGPIFRNIALSFIAFLLYRRHGSTVFLSWDGDCLPIFLLRRVSIQGQTHQGL